ncbi:MAG: flagellar basal-body MS-ring/collar protein FliF [Pseudomonadota bacterium]
MNAQTPPTPSRSPLDTWNRLEMRQQITAVVATIAVIVGCYLLISLASKEQDALLFSGLDGSAAGEIATQLDGMAVPYTVRGSAIYVPESQRDRLRIEMARQGLPANNGGGYELLDNLNGFSTTADMFDAAYWRAKEGELTRTVMAIPAVRSARVHLGVTRSSAFRRGRNDKSASVTIEAPMALSREQATSIQFLTALAVPDLRPDNVAVIDTQRGVIAGPGGPLTDAGSIDPASREQNLALRLTNLLEAHVGLGNAEVSVALDIDQTSVAQTERVVDPDSRQIATRSLMEERDTEANGSGLVTVASNLPDGDAEEPDLNTPIMRTKRDEDIVYTGTEIERVTQQQAGAISRMSVAVLLNERFTADDEGNLQLDPRSPEEVAALEALVAGAAGIREERGDQLTIQILPFQAMPEAEFTSPTFVEQYVMPRAVDLAQMVFLGLIIIVVGLFILKPAFSPKVSEAEQAALSAPTAESLDAATLLTMLTQENPDDAAAILDDWFEKETEAA